VLNGKKKSSREKFKTKEIAGQPSLDVHDNFRALLGMFQRGKNSEGGNTQIIRVWHFSDGFNNK